MEPLGRRGILEICRIDRMPVEQVRTRVREFKTVNKAHDRRLAAAIRTKQGNELATIDLQRHTIDNRMPRIENTTSRSSMSGATSAPAPFVPAALFISIVKTPPFPTHIDSSTVRATTPRTTRRATPQRPRKRHRASQTRRARALDTHRQSRDKA